MLLHVLVPMCPERAGKRLADLAPPPAIRSPIIGCTLVETHSSTEKCAVESHRISMLPLHKLEEAFVEFTIHITLCRTLEQSGYITIENS